MSKVNRYLVVEYLKDGSIDSYLANDDHISPMIMGTDIRSIFRSDIKQVKLLKCLYKDGLLDIPEDKLDELGDDYTNYLFQLNLDDDIVMDIEVEMKAFSEWLNTVEEHKVSSGIYMVLINRFTNRLSILKMKAPRIDKSEGNLFMKLSSYRYQDNFKDYRTIQFTEEYINKLRYLIYLMDERVDDSRLTKRGSANDNIKDSSSSQVIDEEFY